jgi:hypothetical protein
MLPAVDREAPVLLVERQPPESLQPKHAFVCTQPPRWGRRLRKSRATLAVTKRHADIPRVGQHFANARLLKSAGKVDVSMRLALAWTGRYGHTATDADAMDIHRSSREMLTVATAWELFSLSRVAAAPATVIGGARGHL